ncbi:hypothetical protein SISNIDRAFT_490023 [Sistotremastrum niveocremeum HHB9708]|uniref:Transcobalamin-like C-terminal domain-containing protein n=1 Tax=Sistotremastrum niveocremeum HHB9708 TaxID=1314777 RepID=A0A164PCS3_9AGAM|nr:hypothetical protein SISNIDRAFT_490023 [Sistotremastrum niveocremeum HHB9708]
MFGSKLATLFLFAIQAWVAVAHMRFNGRAPSTNLSVSVRIEGSTTTIFEGDVFTSPREITTASGGTHECDGTNDGTNPTPGPTCTTALDSASGSQTDFTYDGTFDSDFDDFFITRIAGDSQNDVQFWGLLVNFQFTPVGGCQEEVQTGDQVLWAFDAFDKTFFLHLTGPSVASLGVPTTFTVTDGMTGVPIAGATIGSSTSDAAGHITITFTTGGKFTLKAEQPDSLRSNALVVTVS